MDKEHIPDIIVRLVDFNDGACFNGYKINKPSVERLLDNPEFQLKLLYGKLLGLNTHSGRDDVLESIERDYRKISEAYPYEDYLIKHKDLANVICSTWIEGNSWYAGLDLIGMNESVIRRLIKLNSVNLGVSISVIATLQGNEYIVEDLRGVDFTMTPAFKNSVITEINFSARGRGKYTFNINSCDVQFSHLDERLRESRRNLPLALQQRINFVVRYLRSHPDISERQDKELKRYLREPIYYWMVNSFEEPERSYIQHDLKINRFVSPEVTSVFNQILYNTKQNRRSRGDSTINPSFQLKLIRAYKSLLGELYAYVNSQALGSSQITTENNNQLVLI